MMLLLYNFLQFALLPFVGLPLLCYFLCRPKYRRHLAARLGRLPDVSGLDRRSPVVWFHALSVGEVNAAVPLVKAFSQKRPEAGIVCSAATATGIESLEEKLGDTARVIMTSPFDLYPCVKRVADALAPACFVMVETDVWPNWIWYLRRKGVGTLLVNGSISERSARRLSRLGPLCRFFYGGFDRIAMQSHDDEDRVLGLGLDPGRVEVLGNLKYDLDVPALNDAEKMQFKMGLGLDVNAPLWVAGSTHPGEEESVFSAHAVIRSRVPGAQLLLAPRHPERGAEVAELARSRGFNVVKRSDGGGSGRIDVLVLDTLGELLRCYGICEAAFVGGTLVDIGGHNLLEPAACGVPVLFGPFTESCRETAEELKRIGGGIEVSGAGELGPLVVDLLRDDSRRMETGRRGWKVVERNRGAVARHLDLIEEVLRRP